MKTFTLFLICMTLSLAGCQNNAQSIEPSDARTLMAEDYTVVLLDVRTPEEFDTRHIPGAVLIPLQSLEADVEDIIPDKQTPIIVYCRTGNRTIDAIGILKEKGYEDLHDLGGIVDWPYETTD